MEISALTLCHVVGNKMMCYNKDGIFVSAAFLKHEHI